MCELRDAVEKLTDWKEGKALIVHGVEHSFCSGADLSTVREFSQPKVIILKAVIHACSNIIVL